MHLSVWDYLVIVIMLVISTGIGIYFAVRSGRKQTSSDYFLGNRQMSVVPVALSLAATVMSAITYIGTPAEAYFYGPKYGLMFAVRAIVPFIVMFCFVPVFYRLKLTTMYQYLELRFNNTVRFLVIICKSSHEFMYMGFVLYTPALALSTVAGISLPLSIVSIGIVCTFYTTIGGIKAVIWTDVFQAIYMVIGAIVMILAGTIHIGGPSEGWKRAVAGGRGELVDFNIDPTVRLTFWSIMIGGTSVWTMAGATKQSLVQRYNSCSSERDAKLASFLGIVGMGVIELLAVVTGMTIYAYYHDCDPLTSNKITRRDQIVPYFMLDFFQSFPGVPGLLIGGAFCASLSSISSVLNSLTAATGQDIIKTIWPNMPDMKYSILVKVISAIYGVLGIFLALLASVLGDVMQTSISIGGIMGGPAFGVFALGLFFPRANSMGATVGLIGGTLTGVMLYVGSKIYPPVKNSPPLSTDGCYLLETSNETILDDNDYITSYTEQTTDITSVHSLFRQDGPAVFRLSFLYMTSVTSFACIILGLVVSYITSRENPSVTDPRYLAPIVARYYQKRDAKSTTESTTYKTKEYVSLKQV